MLLLIGFQVRQRVAVAEEVSTDIEYDEVGPLLVASALQPSAPEAHGMLCGFLCGGAPDPLKSWFESIFPDASEERASLCAALRPFAEKTLRASDRDAFQLELLAPPDDRSLSERAVALYDWVRGFLFALGVLGISERDLSEDNREVYRDFADLTRMDLDDLGEGEENEAALLEVTEFARVAAMLIREDRVGASAGSAK